MTDPLLDAPFSVSLVVTVYDFGTMAEDAGAKEEARKEKKGASK